MDMAIEARARLSAIMAERRDGPSRRVLADILGVEAGNDSRETSTNGGAKAGGVGRQLQQHPGSQQSAFPRARPSTPETGDVPLLKVSDTSCSSCSSSSSEESDFGGLNFLTAAIAAQGRDSKETTALAALSGLGSAQRGRYANPPPTPRGERSNLISRVLPKNALLAQPTSTPTATLKVQIPVTSGVYTPTTTPHLQSPAANLLTIVS